MDIHSILLPVPRQITLAEGICALPETPTVLWRVPQAWYFPAMPTLREALPPESEMTLDAERRADILLLEDPACPPEGFVLTAGAETLILRSV